MRTSSPPTIYPSFNARNLSASDVAKTFVPSSSFEKLCGNSHSLIVGPRGSGKTTLLKMLQKTALDAWNHPDAERIRSSVKFTGVYIPTDVNWDKQIDALGDRQATPQISEQLSICAFTTHFLRSLALAFEERIEVPESSTKLNSYCDVVARISKTWRTKVPNKTFQSLRQAMSERLADLQILATRLRFLGKVDAFDVVASTEWLHLGFLESATFALDLVNDFIGDKDKKWGFLFDELELSPAAIRRHLLDSLRSTDQRMLFKLSLVPYSDEMVRLEDTIKSASSGNDFTVVKLWYPNKEDASSFCGQLWNATLFELGKEKVPPQDVLGESFFQSMSTDWTEHKTAYGPESRITKRFVSLARKDETFAAFLREKKIDPSNMDQLTGGQRPQIVRKIVSIVALRDALLRSVDENGTASLLTKVVPDLYSGAESIFAMVEGNPRWFKGLVGELIKEFDTDKLIPRNSQVAQVVAVSDRFRALLRTIPCPPVGKQGTSRGILGVLDKIGDYFHESQVAGPFSMDPIGSFVVHSRARSELIESLGKAVNAGAIVYIPGTDGDSDGLLSSMRGKRFRLSYLLAVRYRILLRLEREVSLQTILEDDNDELPRFLLDVE